MLLLAVWHNASAQADAIAPIVIPAGARVGLVLSGGGARGLAHAGVIRVLEAQGIRPVVITGTSIGSIIGALYASGYSADDIIHVSRTMDWREALSDASPRTHQLYPFRQLEAGMTAELRMSITRQGIAFPRGAIEGQHLLQVLGDLFQRDGRALRIENLPVRFAAVATDLETGNAVVLDRGELAQAVRASMSVPGALAPVERDGKLLVDGGISDNMPVDIARRLGADFIIAVDVSTPLLTRTELDSIIAVTDQLSNFMVRFNTAEQHKQALQQGVVVVPDLEGIGSAAFDRADDIIAAGERAAAALFGATDTAADAQPEAPDAQRPLPVIGFVRVVNDSPVSDEVVRNQIHQPLGQPLDRARLEDDLSRLYGLDYFSVVRYHLVRDHGENGIEVVARARENGNNWLKLGLELSDNFRGDNDFGLATSLRAAGLNRYGGTAHGHLKIGTSPEFDARFLQPLDAALRYFVEPALGARSGVIDLYIDDVQQEPLASYRKTDYWASLSGGRLLWQEVAEIRAGVERLRGELDFRNGLDIIGEQTDASGYDDGFYFVSVGWDTLDDLGFPSQGARWSLKREQHDTGIEASSNFARHVADFTLATHLGRNVLLLEADAAISHSDEASFVELPYIGGFLELSGLPPRSRFGRHRALVRTVYYHRVTNNRALPIDVPVFVGASLEKGNVWLDRDNMSWRDAITAGSVFVGAKTPLGPAYLSIGATNQGNRSVSIFLGQRFR